MAQNNLGIKIISRAIRNPYGYRKLHNRTGGCLHNTVSASPVVDSMGRVHSKLHGSEWEKNGLKRVGPTQAVLESVGDAVAAPREPELKLLMDPNGTMWQVYKDKSVSSPSVSLKKLKQNINIMKQNIKEYYCNRLQQNQELFSEAEQPLKVSKVEFKKPQEKTEPSELDLNQLKKIVKRKESLLQRLQMSKPEERLPEKEEVQVKPAKEEGCVEYGKIKDLYKSVRSPRGQGKSTLEDLGDKTEVMEKVMKQPLWITMGGRNKGKVDVHQKNVGFTDVNSKSPLFNFKYNIGPRNQRRMVDSQVFRDVAFYQQGVDRRQFSTMPRNYMLKVRGKAKIPFVNQSKKFSRYQTPSVEVQTFTKQTRTNKRTNHYGAGRALSTCSPFNNCNDPCLPPPLPPRQLDRQAENLPKCETTSTYKWGECPKITLCGCLPPHERTNMDCDIGVKYEVSSGKKPEYKCPSFSECTRIVQMNKKKVSECCKPKSICVIHELAKHKKKPFTYAIERMENNLGQRYWTAGCKSYSTTPFLHLPRRNFSTNKQFWNNNNHKEPGTEEQCEKKKGELPCLKATDIPGARGKKQTYKGRGSCERICLPCCQPARDPPECFSSYTKPPCTKFRNPRPSFSECRKMFPMKHVQCECEIPRKPICNHKQKKDGSGVDDCAPSA